MYMRHLVVLITKLMSELSLGFYPNWIQSHKQGKNEDLSREVKHLVRREDLNLDRRGENVDVPEKQWLIKGKYSSEGCSFFYL